MFPVTSKDKDYKSDNGFFKKLSGWFTLIFSNQISKKLFWFLCLNLSFAFVELVYGICINSLALISDSFHMFFDCIALLTGLVASVITKWPPNDRFSYGYVRAEVLAVFVNALFLFFIAFFIFSEAVERAIEPPEVEHGRLLVVSVLGLLVNLVGIFAFQHGCKHKESCHGGSSRSYSHEESRPEHCDGERDNEHLHLNGNHLCSHKRIMQGVFLHLLADTLGSISVIVSAVLINKFGWMMADPICSMFISFSIGVSVVPLIKESVCILMQRQPKELDPFIPGCYRRVMELKGVHSVQDPHFWTLCSEIFIGTIKLEVAMNADIKYILSHTHKIFTQAGVCELYVQIDQTLT